MSRDSKTVAWNSKNKQTKPYSMTSLTSILDDSEDGLICDSLVGTSAQMF